MRTDFYVYCWTNLNNGKKYIGKGYGKRARWHLPAAFREGYDTPLYRAIRKHGPEAFSLAFLTRAPHGYNLTDGGDGVVGYKATPQARQKRSESYKGPGNPMYGKKHSIEWRAQQSTRRSGEKNPMYGKPPKSTPDSRRKQSLALQGAKAPLAKLTDADVLRIRELLASGETQVAVACWYAMAQCTISDIARRKTWTHI